MQGCKMKIKRRNLTLLEIMIVIVLIGLIGSVIGFNVKGSLDEGKAFKTRQAKEQIQDILMLEVARGTDIVSVLEDKEAVLANSGLIKDPKAFLKDGWGIPFTIKVVGAGQDRISVISDKLRNYERTKKARLGKAQQANDDDDDED